MKVGFDVVEIVKSKLLSLDNDYIFKYMIKKKFILRGNVYMIRGIIFIE